MDKGFLHRNRHDRNDVSSAFEGSEKQPWLVDVSVS